MKVAILCPTLLSYSGIDRVVEHQANSIALKGDEVSIFALKANIVPSQNVKLHILGTPNNLLFERIYRLFYFVDFGKSNRWVQELKGFDCVYSHHYPMNWLAYLAKRRYGIKYIYYNHGYPPLKTFPNFVERFYVYIISIFANWTIKRADEVISVSQYLRRELKKETSMDSIVIYNEIDTQRFHPGIDGGKIRQKHHLNNNPLILFVGRITPYKGVDLLINAFTMVKQLIPETRLIIIGKHSLKNYSDKLRRMSDTSIIFEEDVLDEDMPLYYAACDVYATASLWEGFDLPMAEAQACGKHVVAFDIGSHQEVIKVGTQGILVPVGNTIAMSIAIESFLKNRARLK